MKFPQIQAVSLDMCERRRLKSALCDRCSSAAVQYALSGPPDRGVGAGDTNTTAYAAAAGPGRSRQEVLRLFSDENLFRYL